MAGSPPPPLSLNDKITAQRTRRSPYSYISTICIIFYTYDILYCKVSIKATELSFCSISIFCKTLVWNHGHAWCDLCENAMCSERSSVYYERGREGGVVLTSAGDVNGSPTTPPPPPPQQHYNIEDVQTRDTATRQLNLSSFQTARHNNFQP